MDSASPQQKLLIYCCLFADYNPIRNTDGGLSTLAVLKTLASSIDSTYSADDLIPKIGNDPPSAGTYHVIVNCVTVLLLFVLIPI